MLGAQTVKTQVLIFILFVLVMPAFAGPPTGPGEWKHPLVYEGELGSPLVEVTPFVFEGRLYLLENWQKHWEYSQGEHGEHFEEDEIRIRDVASDEIVSTPFVGHGLGMALVHEGRVYVFGGDWGEGEKWHIKDIEMASSDDLVNWTNPQVVLEANEDENFFNVSVCRGDGEYIMLVESNDPQWPAFTFKYFRSDDLVNWEQIPDAYYGEEKYVGGPALYRYGAYFYTLYLESLGNRHYETRVTRSKDLVHWQDAPDDRPFVTYDPESRVHPLRSTEIYETNASDAEFCYWQGETIVYYTGGDQRYAGDLKRATFDGAPQELLEYFYVEPELVTPTARQLRYQNNQLGCFVHYGPATYIGGGDYLMAPKAEKFDPGNLDAEQWILAAKLIGAKHIILTAKHHNGFCLWPTATTNYSVESSPWKNGEGDVVREFVDAARKHGIQPGLYISAGDTHFGVNATPEPRGVRKIVGDVEAYFPVFMKQLEELLTNYGDLEVVWFDGAYNPFDPDVLDMNGKPVGDRYAGKITELVRELQPDAVIMGAAEPDIRWAGSEQGVAPYSLWYVIEEGEGRENWLPDDAAGWFVPEANVHTREHWFWSPDSDETLKTPEQMMDIYHESIGRGANLLVNLTPNMEGVVPDAEVAMLEAFGRDLEKTFGTPVASTDAPKWDEGHTIQLLFEQPTVVNRVVIDEDLRHGQRIRAYRIEALADGTWTEVAEGESVGRNRIEAFDAVEAGGIRVMVTDSVPLPHIKSLAAYGPE